MEQVTIEKLSTFYDVWGAVEWAEDHKMYIPDRPEKPRLNTKHTANDARKYTELLSNYEYDMIAYKEKLKESNEYNEVIDNIITDYICMEAGLQDIPEQYRSKVWNKAYQDGHSEGHIGIYDNLVELIDIFN